MDGNENHAESSDAVEEMYCELCKTKGRYRAADGFCVDCVKYFCSNCLESHSDFLPTHILKDKTSMPQDVCVKPCPNHADEIIKFYCIQCDEFFCSQCKEKDHLSCKNVSHLPEIVQGIDIKQQLNDVKDKLASNLKAVEERECEVEFTSSVPSVCAVKAKADLQSKKIAVVQWLDRNFVNIKDEIDEIKTSDETALATEISALTALKNKAITVKTDIESRQLPANQCELFMTLKETQRQQKQIEDKLKQARQHRFTSYAFKPSAYLEKLLRDGVMGELAKKDVFSECDIYCYASSSFWVNKEETTFRYTVQNIRRFKGQIQSTRFWCQSLPWHLLVRKQKNEESSRESLAVFLKCYGETRKNWSCYAEAEFRIIVQDGDDCYSKEFRHRFCRNEDDRGFLDFLPWDELLDPNKGYCKDDNIILEVHLVAW